MDSRIEKAYKFWRNSQFFDMQTRDEINALIDEKEIEDRFYCDLRFGTGGMRGIMGAGTNRLNKYTVGRATRGVADYLKDSFCDAELNERGVVIAYDTRNNSRDFAETAADIMTANGIKAYVFDKPVPTPELSFAVKQLGCILGIVITASHNPKEDNGYKVYDEYGCQLVPHQAKTVIKYIDKIKDYTSISFNGNNELKEYIDITDDFVDAVLKESLSDEGKNGLKIVYTPLHGTGNIPVRMALTKAGFTNTAVVPEQEKSDGDFSTVRTPNPEDKAALELGIRLADETGADIVIGTDPDCDRVGVAVKTAGGYKLLTGNQTGALLMDFVLSHKELSRYKKPAVAKTVVTSELGADIARKHGVSVFSTLTGFKYIGEKITQFEQAGINHDECREYDFIFGYEESYGYLAGTHARDKDAVVACLLICEMAAEYKSNGKTLFDRLNELYAGYGYFCDEQDSFRFPGKAGKEKMDAMMAELRGGMAPFAETDKIVDYNIPQLAEPGFGELPTSNVLKYFLKDGSWIAIRPSGTEPKLKIYYSIKGDTQQEAERKLIEYRHMIKSRFNI